MLSTHTPVSILDNHMLESTWMTEIEEILNRSLKTKYESSNKYFWLLSCVAAALSRFLIDYHRYDPKRRSHSCAISNGFDRNI